MITKDVTLKALVRVLGQLILQKKLMEHWKSGEGPKCFESFLSAWRDEVPKFRSEGFYERFPAEGQVETRSVASTRTCSGRSGLESPESRKTNSEKSETPQSKRARPTRPWRRPSRLSPAPRRQLRLWHYPAAGPQSSWAVFHGRVEDPQAGTTAGPASRLGPGC
jgi:hypothetical protein